MPHCARRARRAEVQDDHGILPTVEGCHSFGAIESGVTKHAQAVCDRAAERQASRGEPPKKLQVVGGSTTFAPPDIATEQVRPRARPDLSTTPPPSSQQASHSRNGHQSSLHARFFIFTPLAHTSHPFRSRGATIAPAPSTHPTPRSRCSLTHTHIAHTHCFNLARPPTRGRLPHRPTVPPTR